MFDSTIGAGTVVMPYGGKYQLTPQDGMAAKIPVIHGDTTTCSIMTYGYTPELSKWSPFHGGIYCVLESLSKMVAMGGDFRKARLSFQEYFERLNKDPEKWGKPFAALLGAFEAQKAFGIPAIGGKDSMSGTFEDMTVPPTIISFAVEADKVQNVLSNELKKAGSSLYLFEVEQDDNKLIDYDKVMAMYDRIRSLNVEGKLLSAKAVSVNGLVDALAKMAFGNKIGVDIADIDEARLFAPLYGSIIVETTEALDDAELIGKTTDASAITCMVDAVPMKEQTPLKPLRMPVPSRRSSCSETGRQMTSRRPSRKWQTPSDSPR